MEGLFEIQGQLSNGMFGEVYYGSQKSTGQAICLKYNSKEFINNMESEVLGALHKKGFANFPGILAKGKIDNKPFLV